MCVKMLLNEFKDEILWTQVPRFQFCPLSGIKITSQMALLMVNKGPCCSVSIPVSNTSSHDITIKKGSVLVTLKLIS